MTKIILTGDRPTGPLHLGHYVGSLRARVELQETYQQFVMIADLQALTDYAKEPQKVQESILEVMLDYLAVGLDPEKTTICLQSSLPALAELTFYYLNLVTWNRLKHNPTVKQEITQKGYGESVPAGFMIYPISQAADITAFKANLVPVGEDQIPMIEQTNEVVKSFNRIYGKTLVKTEALVSKYGRLPGTDGFAKMSKSMNNAIYLKDTPDVISKKIKKMYTDPNHLCVEDSGTVEGNPVFDYLDAFGTDLKKIQELKDHYRRGGLGDSVVKKYLLDVILKFMEPLQKRRRSFATNPQEVLAILKRGTDYANEVTNQTLSEVRKAVGILEL